MNLMGLLDGVKESPGPLKMSTQTSNFCIAFSERDWPCESLRGMYHHRACKQCGKEYIGPKRSVYCFICENNKKDIDKENGDV